MRFSYSAIASVLFIAPVFARSISIAESLISGLSKKDLELSPLGANCTADTDCLSEKCWPTNWYYGQKICSPSAAGVACVDGSTCLSGLCTADGICDKNNGTSSNLHGPDGPLCYTTSDCYSEVCMSPYLGGGQNTQCWPAGVGHACDARTGCITGNCTAAVCSPVEHGLCYQASDCLAPGRCDVLSMSSPAGYCNA